MTPLLIPSWQGCILRWQFFIIVALNLVVTAQTQAALQYDKTRPLLDDSGKSYSVAETQALLERLNEAKSRVIFYLHGRGEEPEKSFNFKKTGGGAVIRLRTEYNARVILIGWNSKSKGYDRSEPLEHTDEGADTMSAVLAQLAEHLKKNPSSPRPSLLVHSMGSIVLAKTVKRIGWPTDSTRPLFSNILLSESDVDSQGHGKWLSTISNAEKVYVTQNRQDTVLKESTDSRNPQTNFALGLEPVPPFADKARYIDLTDALAIKRKWFFLKVGAHQVFSKSWMGKHINTCQFITKALRGEIFEPDQIDGIAQTSPGHFKAIAKTSPNDSCFKHMVAEGDFE